MVSEGVGKGGVDQVPDHQALVSHLYNQLLSALVRLELRRGDGRKLGGRGLEVETGVSVIEGDEVGEEGEEVLLFRGVGRGGGDGVERRLLRFLQQESLQTILVYRLNCCTYPNVSSCFCRNQISFVKYEVCMVEDDHGESGMWVGGGAVLTRTLAPPPPPSPDSILT